MFNLHFLFQAMQFDYVPSLRATIILILQVVAVYSYEYIDGVSECTMLTDIPGFLGCDVVCRGMDSSRSNASKLLPNCTSQLEINYSFLPTNISLAPHLTALTSLYLSRNNMEEISTIMFQGLSNLRNLSLNKNNFKYLSEGVFRNTPNLEVLDLSENSLISVKDIVPALTQLRNLSVLNLSQNRNLTIIENENFIALENVSLSALDISKCAIKIVEEKAFKPLKSLSLLDISNNPVSNDGLTNLSWSLHEESLKTLKAAKLGGVTHFLCSFLKWLETTRIESLEIENRLYCPSFGNFPYLKSLSIRTELTELRQQHIQGIPNIESLTIQEHRIQNIDKQFASSIHLKFLDLSFSLNPEIELQIEDFAFENLNDLNLINLKHLNIYKIQRYMLYGLRNLKKISLNKSQVQVLECYAFETLSHLIDLDLSSNKLTQLLNCTFYGLINVEDINLSDNSIEGLNGMYPFNDMKNLKYLNLMFNKIVSLPPGIFKKLTNINLLALGTNRITPWMSEILPDKLNGTALYIERNNISYFTDQMFNDVFKLQEIDFAENPINCSYCSTVKLQDWMRNGTTKILHIVALDAYKCSYPARLEYSSIDNVNLTAYTYHCIIVESNIYKTVCAVVLPIIFIGIVSLIVWYFWKWNIRYFVFEIQLNVRKYKEYKDTKHYEFDAFVSYCEKDLEWIISYLVPALENSNPGIRLCLPDRHFQPGYSVLDNITWAIDQSRSTVIVLSNEYLKCDWCLYNIQMAHNMLFEKTRSGLIVILLEEIQKDKLTKDLEYIFRTRTCIWWTKNPVGQKLFWKRLHLAITRPMDKGISAHIT